MKKFIVPLALLLACLIAITVIYFVAPEVFYAFGDYLSKLPDISIEVGNMSINIPVDSINIGEINFEDGIPKFGMNLWSIILIVCAVVFFVLSCLNNVLATILSIVSLVFPVVFGANLMNTYSEALAMGASPKDAAGAMVVSLILLGLATFAAPSAKYGRCVGEDMIKDELNRPDQELNRIKERIEKIRRYILALDHGKTPAELHSNYDYRYEYSTNPKERWEAEDDYRREIEKLRALEVQMSSAANLSKKEKRKIESEMDAKRNASAFGMSAFYLVIYAGLLLLGAYLMMRWGWGLAIIAILNAVYILAINTSSMTLGVFD